MWRYSILYCKGILWTTLYMQYRKVTQVLMRGKGHLTDLAIIPTSGHTAIPELCVRYRLSDKPDWTSADLSVSEHQVDQQLRQML